MAGDGHRVERKRTSVGQPAPHDSAHLHTTGQAAYTDDIPEPRGLLHMALGVSEVAHARIRTLDLSKVSSSPGVVATLLPADIPGENNFGPIVHDDPILAEGTAMYAGHPLFAVLAETVDAARRAAREARIEYEELPAILDSDAAISESSFVLPAREVTRGDPASAIEAASHRIRRRVTTPNQDQFYLETHIALALPGESGGLRVYSSTQHPDEVQALVARATCRDAKDVTVICRRMGGAFGGKESQAALFACLSALGAVKTGRPCKLRMERDADMVVTGKRHDFTIDYDVGFNGEGVIAGADFTLASRCGISADLSGPINDRAMFHCDNAYYLDAVRIASHRCKTNTVSNTAFRGFGGPQGMFAIEHAVDDIARTLGLDPLTVRRRNFYGLNDRNRTPYGQVIEDNVIAGLVDKLAVDSDYLARREAIRELNARDDVFRQGIALTPVKFGISFTNTMLNQAGALVNVYKDGTVRLNHGGTEMGQGLYTKVAQVVADELGITLDRIRVTAADTSMVPNASATAASSGSDMNGMAAQKAARKIRDRLASLAAQKFNVTEAEIEFSDNRVTAGQQSMAFEELVQAAWAARIQLSATGFYRTPKIHFDPESFSGRPFYYYAYGAACSEVIVDTLTGEHRLVRVDILHDCGDSLNPALDRGQVIGGFVQGSGWLTSEELVWSANGVLQTHAPSTYKIPACSDIAPDFRVELLHGNANHEDTVYRSKAVGEPPFMLALSVFFAIRDAIATEANPLPDLAAPATPEAVLRAFEDWGA
jgi:xanthine dehydrogenase large subunit